MSVQDWVGTIEQLSSNGDGKGVLSVAIDKGVYVKTWNNALSDIGDRTLIEPGFSLFQNASVLRKGEKVKFRGPSFEVI